MFPRDGRGPVFGAVAVLAAILVVVLVLVLAGGGPYSVKADFVTASQLVKGNAVKVSGNTIGSVGDISLTDDGKARVTLNIDGEGYHPLRRGTRATIRQTSLSGVANRYVDLQLGGADGDDIPDGGAPADRRTRRPPSTSTRSSTPSIPRRAAGVQKSVGSCATSRPATRRRPTRRCATSTPRCRARRGCSQSSTAARPTSSASSSRRRASSPTSPHRTTCSPTSPATSHARRPR